MTLAVTHSVVTGASADPDALVDGVAWDAAHSLTGAVGPEQGGTGVANSAASTITITGAFGTTFTVTATTALTLPTTGTLVTLAGSETLSNKTLSAPVINTPTITVHDSLFALIDNSDSSKQLNFQLSGITTATSRTLTVPDANTTIVGTDATQALTNKTYEGLTISTSSGTLTIQNGKTATFSGSGTFAATDGATYTFPTTTATIARTDSGQTFTGTQAFGTITFGTETITGLTDKASPHATNDYLILYDAAGTAVKKATPTAIVTAGVTTASTGAAGVSELATDAEMQTGTDSARVPTVQAVRNGTGAGWSSFAATLSGNQGSIADSTFTTVTFDTEVYDVGSNFSSNTWTPPAGKVHMDFSVAVSGDIAVSAQCIAAIFKNGSALRHSFNYAGSGVAAANVSCDDIANGTDAYTARVWIDVASGTATALSAYSHFNGHMIN